ncbi:MAG: hypothetical protein ABIE42_08765 [Candidatus Eisenbacteria bacterium]
MLRLSACKRRAATCIRTAALLALASLLAAGCGQEGETGGPDTPGTSSMTESDYVAHIAALTIAVEEGRSGKAAYARTIELGSKGHSREQVEEFAALLRSRPKRWVEIEREIDTRIGELRSDDAGQADGVGGE